MDWNCLEGNWKQTAGKIKEKWGKLTDDDLTQNDGNNILRKLFGRRRDVSYVVN